MYDYGRFGKIIMETLVISPKFTIEDIHKVRENNYNITKDMRPQERRDYYNKRGMESLLLTLCIMDLFRLKKK